VNLLDEAKKTTTKTKPLVEVFDQPEKIAMVRSRSSSALLRQNKLRPPWDYDSPSPCSMQLTNTAWALEHCFAVSILDKHRSTRNHSYYGKMDIFVASYKSLHRAYSSPSNIPSSHAQRQQASHCRTSPGLREAGCSRIPWERKCCFEPGGDPVSKTHATTPRAAQTNIKDGQIAGATG
jgi:hypothetical protein